uniref:glucuronosyltransferase n=1 Tax=Steinernema glaseri TaxID=37863 RepID=A0A1I7Y655_9BILA
MLRAAFLFLLLAASVAPLKVAVFTPEQANSQIIWNKRVSEELAKAGHDVTMILIKNMRLDHPAVKIHPNITVWQFDASTEDGAEIQAKMKEMVFSDVPMWDKRVRTSFSKMSQIFLDSCEKTLRDKEFLQRLVDAKFDIAFSHMYDYCPIGLIHYTKIPTWIWLNSGPLVDYVAHDVGVHSPASYVPPIMSDASDEMTFVQRLKSQIGQFLFPILHPMMVPNPQTALFRRVIDPNFPDLRTLGKQCPLVMVNSNELYDLPRPILHKVIYIGGLGMRKVNAKPLEGVGLLLCAPPGRALPTTPGQNSKKKQQKLK